jgi:hypothetical protein
MGSDVHGAEPTGWELMRTMKDLREDMRDQFEKMGERQDRNVSKELFQAHQMAVAREFADHAQQLADLKDDHDAVQAAGSNRRWWILGFVLSGVVGPFLVAYLTMTLLAK